MSDQYFELSEIYDDTDAVAYRLGAQAVTIFGQRGACVIRPWHWNESSPEDVLEAPDGVSEGIGKMLGAGEEWSGEIELGELVIWSSRRTKRDEVVPPWNEEFSAFVVQRRDSDPQPVGNAVFNRRLIREAAQAFIEDWEGAGGMNDRVALRVIKLDNGRALEMKLGQIQAFVMELASSPGDERMPLALPKCQCQWEEGDSPCPLHGEDEDAEPIIQAGTSPLPFIQVGMWLKSPFRDIWQVVGIDEDLNDRTCIRLRSGDGAVIERPSSVVRRWTLTRQFDPNSINTDEPLSFSGL